MLVIIGARQRGGKEDFAFETWLPGVDEKHAMTVAMRGEVLNTDATTLMIGVLTGAIGGGYFMYGKRQQKMVTMLTGVLLCVYPYFVSSVILLILIGVILMAAPFFFDF